MGDIMKLLGQVLALLFAMLLSWMDYRTLRDFGYLMESELKGVRELLDSGKDVSKQVTCLTPVWCTAIWCIPFGARHMVHSQMVPRGTFSALGRMVPRQKVPKRPNGAL